MKTLKRYLMPICFVLAVVLLLGMTLNLYKPIKSWTTKKVVNPDNLLSVDMVEYYERTSMNGITITLQEDGSFHAEGIATDALNINLLFPKETNLSLEAGKTYSFTYSMKDAAVRGCYVYLMDKTNGKHYVGSDPDFQAVRGQIQGPFKSLSGADYLLYFACEKGAVVDVDFYPCLVEGAEPGSFYVNQ